MTCGTRGRDFWTIYSRTCRQYRTTLCMRYYVIWAHGAPRSLTLIWRTLFRKETVIDICLSTWIIFVYITMDSPESCLRILFETVQRTNQTFSFVSNILFETTERLGNCRNRTNETFSLFIFQHGMGCH